MGYVAIDVNEDNVTAVSSDGEVKVFNLLKLKKAGYGCFERKRTLQRKYCKDRRVLKKALSKLSENHRNKVSTAIVKWCKEKGYGLIHEDLKGLRKNVNKKSKCLNKFNGKVQLISKRSKKLKRRLNNWWFRKFLNQNPTNAPGKGLKQLKANTLKAHPPFARYGSKTGEIPEWASELEKCGLRANRHIVACVNLFRWELTVQAQPPSQM
ncbi:MAG: hypothetical protein ACTSVF_00620 [Candidatus Asgardarchaeia archaeon]